MRPPGDLSVPTAMPAYRPNADVWALAAIYISKLLAAHDKSSTPTPSIHRLHSYLIQGSSLSGS